MTNSVTYIAPPAEIWLEIFKYLHPSDLTNLICAGNSFLKLREPYWNWVAEVLQIDCKDSDERDAIHIPIQELVFYGVGDSSNFPSASRSVSMNTEARRRRNI